MRDQILQIELYDWLNSIDTHSILDGDDFYSALPGVGAASAMPYQPAYTAAVRRPLKRLIRDFPIVGAPSTCVVDLGCGRGKVLHVAHNTMHYATLIGVDIHPALVAAAVRNFGHTVPNSVNEFGHYAGKVELYCDTSKLKLLVGSVSDVNYDELLAAYDVVIIHNKNSFDYKTTAATFESIKRACAGKTLFYIYNNPVFEEIFKAYPCVFQMHGWHKNWNAKVFNVATAPRSVSAQEPLHVAV